MFLGLWWCGAWQVFFKSNLMGASQGWVNGVFVVNRDKMLAMTSSSLPGALTTTSTFLLGNPSMEESFISGYCKSDTGTYTVACGTGTATSSYTVCTSAGVAMNTSNCTFSARANEWFEIGSITGSPTLMPVTITVRPTGN